jgi:hypothetical protein
MLPGVVVPISPQPPPATPLADLVLTSMPPGCQMEIVQVILDRRGMLSMR